MKPAAFKFFNPQTERINFHFLEQPTGNELMLAHRFDARIEDDHTIQLTVGLQISSPEIHASGSTKTTCTVEMVAKFIFDEALESYQKLSDIVGIANMVAIVIPFVRERIFSCYSGTHFNVIINPINIHELIKTNSDSFTIADNRQKQIIKTVET
jgi:preprotein translocase subunit SecB